MRLHKKGGELLSLQTVGCLLLHCALWSSYLVETNWKRITAMAACFPPVLLEGKGREPATAPNDFFLSTHCLRSGQGEGIWNLPFLDLRGAWHTASRVCATTVFQSNGFLWIPARFLASKGQGDGSVPTCLFTFPLHHARQGARVGIVFSEGFRCEDTCRTNLTYSCFRIVTKLLEYSIQIQIQREFGIEVQAWTCSHSHHNIAELLVILQSRREK